MTKILITEYMDSDAVADLAETYDVIYDPDLVDDRARLLALLPSVEALIVRNRTQVDAALLGQAPKLKVVGRLGVGLDNIDLAAAAEREIAVCPASGANADSVAEYVLTAMMLLWRPVYHHQDTMLEGAFPRNALSHGREIGGKTLTLIGGGVIGQAVMSRALAMEMTILVVDPALSAPPHPGARLVSFEEGLKRADVVSLHIPLIDATRNLIDAAALKFMKPSALIINTARGGIIDHAALAAALRAEKLGGAAIDVFPQEPASAEDMSLFAGLENIILTPHVAGLTEDANKRVGSITAQNVKAHLEK